MLRTIQGEIEKSLKEGEPFAFFRSKDELVIGVSVDFDDELEEHIIFTAKRFEVKERVFKKKQRIKNGERNDGWRKDNERI